MKAVIEIAPRGSTFRTARKQLKAAEAGSRYGADYRLSFESARALFTELTPSRIDLLEALRRCGPCSVVSDGQEPRLFGGEVADLVFCSRLQTSPSYSELR